MGDWATYYRKFDDFFHFYLIILSVRTSCIVDGLMRFPSFPESIFIPGKLADISSSVLWVGKPSSFADVEMIAPPNASDKEQTSP